MKHTPSNAVPPIGDQPRTQYGAICWRMTEAGLAVLLITSRETGRWIIPKGWPIKGIGAGASAAREAWEEAGVDGKLCDTCLGVFSYLKLLPDVQSIPCVVAIYGLRVEKLSRRYPEQRQRRRKWFAVRDAADLVAEPELRALFLALDQGAQAMPAATVKNLKLLMPPITAQRNG